VAVVSVGTCANICTLLQTDNHANTSSLIFTGWLLFLMLNQQCQSTKGSASILKVQFNFDILIFCITTASTYKIQYGDGVSNTVEEN